MSRKKVLLTGASRGIGKSIKEVLEQTGLYELITPTRQEMDLSDLASVEKYMAHLEAIEILINNAGVENTTPITEVTKEDIQATMTVNLIAPMLIIKQVLPYMIKEKFGKIINLSSIAGLKGLGELPLYDTSKFAVNGLTRTLARKYGEHNILINSVCPGTTQTDMLDEAFSKIDQGVVRAIKAEIPLKRVADPVEIARVVSFLISEENTYLTGQCIAVDGGLLA